MRFAQRDLTGAPIKNIYPSALCLILSDATATPNTSYFPNLCTGVEGFVTAVTSNRDLSRFVLASLAYAGDVRNQKIVFEAVRQLRPAPPNELTSAPLSGEDICAAFSLLAEARVYEEQEGRPTPGCFLIVLSEDKIDCTVPEEVTCLWSADMEESRGNPAHALQPLARVVLHQLERLVP